MDLGVLAHLERGEVEPERRDLPAQLRQLAVRDARQAVRGERRLHHGQLRVQRARARVAAGPGRGLAGQRRARPPQALGDGAQPLAVRLLGEPPPELPDGLGQLLRVARERAAEPPVQPLRRDPGGHGLHQPRRDRLVATEQVLRLEAGGVERDIRGDTRVPVTVRADPRPEPEHRGRERRPGAAVAGVGGEGLAARRAILQRRDQRPVERALEARHGREQRLVEDRERGPDLVERRRRDRAQVAGVPQDRDLLAQPTAEVGVLVRGREGVVELVQQPPDAPQRDQQRAPAGLGGMGGEHGMDPQAADHRPQRGRSVVRREAGDRLADGVVDRAAPGPAGARPEHADPLPLLGQVDELEVEGERLGHGGRIGDVERGHVGRQPLALDVRLEPRVRVAAPERDRPPADPFDHREQLGPGLFRDHLAEQRAQQPDLARQRVARAPDPGPGRLRGDGREARAAGAAGRTTRGLVGFGHAHRIADRRTARHASEGYGSTARAPSRYLAATDDGYGGA